MINKAIILGRIGTEPEGKQFANGDYVCNFSLATSETYKDNQGERVENTEWHKVVLYRKVAEFALNHLKKGDLVYLEGKIKTRSYEGKDGEKRYVTEIISHSINPIVWGKKNKEENVDSSTKERPANTESNQISSNNDMLEDDLPF